jgi:hypothetical protein
MEYNLVTVEIQYFVGGYHGSLERRVLAYSVEIERLGRRN